MVEISKPLFEERFRNLDCNVLLHPWSESCIGSMPLTIFHSYIGSAKFYSIIYAAQILMRGKNLKKKEDWLKMGEYYVRSTTLGCVVSTTCIIFGCLFRKILGGKFHYYAFILVPSTINGVCIYLEPPSRRGLIINLFSSLMLEYWLKTMDKSGYISMTETKQTIMFMLGSGFLFYLMRLEGDKKDRTPLFWLFTPEKVKEKTHDDENPCPHRGPSKSSDIVRFLSFKIKYLCSCSFTEYVYKRDIMLHVSCALAITWIQARYLGNTVEGTAKNFGLGAALTLARVILPKISSPRKAFASIQRQHFKMGLFFGSYIGIYRALICYFCRKRGADSASYALPAGLIAGLSFLFSPSLGFATASVTAALKLYTTILYEKKVLTTKVPLPELLYCICQGTLFHARFMHPETCPSYMFKLSDGVSHGRSALLADFLQELAKIK